MPKNYDIDDIKRHIEKIPLNRRIGTKCLVSSWIKIKDRNIIPTLEKIKGVEVYGDEFRRFHEFK